MTKKHYKLKLFLISFMTYLTKHKNGFSLVKHVRSVSYPIEINKTSTERDGKVHEGKKEENRL